MAATRPYLLKAIEQVKRFADNPTATRGLTETQILEDLRRAHAGIYEDIAAAIGPEARYFNSFYTVTLAKDDEWALLPGAFRKFIGFVKRDSDGTITGRKRHTPGLPGDGGGVALMPDTGRMRFIPKIAASEAGNWELEFESGPIELHYGNPAAELTISGANTGASGSIITLASGFSLYNYAVGDIFKITAGTGVTPARYTITAKVDGSNILITPQIPAVADSTIVGDIYKADRMYFDSSPTKGEMITRLGYYTGARVYVVSGFGEREVASVSSFVAAATVSSTPAAVLLNAFTETPDDTSVYEIRPSVPGAPDQFDEIIAWRAALKYRRIRGEDGAGEGATTREIKHILSEIVRHVGDANVDKAQTVRRPRRLRSASIWS